MKVTSDNTQLNPSSTIDKDSSRGDLDAPLSDAAELDGLSERTTFASVLDRVTQSHKEPAARYAEKHDSAAPTPHESKAKPKDETTDAAAVAVADRSLIREPLGNTEPKTDIHAVLPAADLDQILAACQVQVAAGGRHEVIIDLSHSVLDGLRVKVSADATGRVTTEFLAANDGIKSLLDSRSAELLSLLRSRGINLVNFQSSLAADASGGDNSQSRQDYANRDRDSAPSSSTAANNGAANSSAGIDEIEMGATYRA
jgi:hypothetical protein